MDLLGIFIVALYLFLRGYAIFYWDPSLDFKRTPQRITYFSITRRSKKQRKIKIEIYPLFPSRTSGKEAYKIGVNLWENSLQGDYKIHTK